MKVGGINQNALSGMQKGLAEMQDNSQRVARGEDPVQGLLGTRQGARQVEVSAKVAKTADDAIGKLFDEYA
jgi:hypothetical protein